MKYTIKVKSKEALIKANYDNPDAGVMCEESEFDRYADQIFAGCRATEDVHSSTLYPGGFDNGASIFIKEEIEWVKEDYNVEYTE